MKKEGEYRFYNSLGLGISFLIFQSACTIALIIVLCLPSYREQTGVWGILLLLFFIVLGIGLIIYAQIRCFSSIIIDESGIKRSFANKYFKREILWNELKDIHVVWRMDNWFFFSKSEIAHIPYDDILRRKDQIQLQSCSKLQKAIEYYYTKGYIPYHLYFKVKDFK